MTDKPIPAKIILKLADSAAIGYDFIGLCNTLYRLNLIYYEPRVLRRIKNTLELSVIFQDTQSYECWYDNAEVVKVWIEKFDSLLTEIPQTVEETDVIIEVDEVMNCSCENANFYILQGRTFGLIYELVCGNCLERIPYSRVPVEIKIEEWQNHYQRTYLNWLDSSFFEEEAYRELTNYKKGKLNREGEKIRILLSNYFKIPVYIHYFVDEPSGNHPCLLCGQQGIESGLTSPSRICRNCNTIFGFE